MKTSLILAALLLSSAAFAADAPKVVRQAAAKLKSLDTRTVITAIDNTESPCLPPGRSYNVELQVKTAGWNGLKQEVIYRWETVKTINVGKTGEVMEVCGE